MEKTRPTSKLEEMGWMFAGLSSVFFPLKALRSAKADGHVGELSPRFYGLPTNRSQATTLNQDCADLLAMLQEDEVDLAIMVAN